MKNNIDFEQMVNELDLRLFDAIRTQSFYGDRKSWLALQRAVRRSKSGYTYLEIGSYLGGSIQPYLLDPNCVGIVSIDKRIHEAPNERRTISTYEENSLERMLRNLRSLSPEGVSKLVCFDSDAHDIDPGLIQVPPNICFIDGGHTKDAVMSDFGFCFRVCDPNAVIYFHDDWLVCPALAEIEKQLRRRGVSFVSMKLGGMTYAIGLRDCPIATDALVRGLAMNAKNWLFRMRLRAAGHRYTPKFLRQAARYVARRVLRTVSDSLED